MDELDRARHYQDMMNQEAASKRKTEPRLPATGECHNCGAEIDKPKRFCDPACSGEWEEFNERGATR